MGNAEKIIKVIKVSAMDGSNLSLCHGPPKDAFGAVWSQELKGKVLNQITLIGQAGILTVRSKVLNLYLEDSIKTKVLCEQVMFKTK